MVKVGSQPQGGRPTAERAAEIGAAVVEAAMVAFAKHGMDFRMEQVAALAGVSKQAIYRRWDTKLDLITHAIDTFMLENIDPAPSMEGGPEERLRDFAWRCFDNEVISADRIATFLRSESFRNDALLTKLQEWHVRFSTAYVRRLEALGDSGALQEGDIRTYASILMDLLSGASANLALTGNPSRDEKQRVFEERWIAFRRMAIKS